MALRLFPLIAYLTSSAYLISWVIRLMKAIYQRIKRWAHPPKMQFLLKTLDEVGEEHEIYIFLIGSIFGGMISLWLMHIFVSEWLLVIFIILAVLSDDMRVTSTETVHLEVMVFFDRLAAHIDNHQDLFEILPDCILELPAGRVRKSILDTILRWRTGESFDTSLDAMRKIDPLLDEFILTLLYSGWKNDPVLNIILNRLIKRAGRKWDRVSWCLLIKYKIRNYVPFCRGAFITGMWVILINSSSGLNRVMPDRAVVVLAVLALIGLGLLFFLFHKRLLLWRSLVVSIFMIALAIYTNSLTFPIPAWIQVETLSHQSEIVGNPNTVAPQILPNNQGLPVLFPHAFFTNLPASVTSKRISTPTPAAVAKMILNQPTLISTQTIPQDFNLCCVRSPQPR